MTGFDIACFKSQCKVALLEHIVWIHAQLHTQFDSHISFLGKTNELNCHWLYTVTYSKNNPSAMDSPIELYSCQVVIPD